MSEQQVRRALRDLERSRYVVRVGKLAVAGATALLGLVVWGWVAAITWGLDTHPGTQKAGAMGGFIMGLIICSLVALVAVAGAVAVLLTGLDERRKCSAAYEDEILDGVS